MRRVRTAADPDLAIMAPTITSIATLRMNKISNEPMRRCSSRTATAIAAKESTAPSIHTTPRSTCCCELTAGWGISLCYLSRPMASDELYRKQVARLYERSPFYREKLSTAGFVSPPDLGGLAGIPRPPFTPKDEARAGHAPHPPPRPPPAAAAPQAGAAFPTTGPT